VIAFGNYNSPYWLHLEVISKRSHPLYTQSKSSITVELIKCFCCTTLGTFSYRRQSSVDVTDGDLRHFPTFIVRYRRVWSSGTINSKASRQVTRLKGVDAISGMIVPLDTAFVVIVVDSELQDTAAGRYRFACASLVLQFVLKAE
jgi:hypothetical protein